MQSCMQLKSTLVRFEPRKASCGKTYGDILLIKFVDDFVLDPSQKMADPRVDVTGLNLAESCSLHRTPYNYIRFTIIRETVTIGVIRY